MATAHKLEDHIGKQYNRITITGEAPRTKKEKEWSYICTCGKMGSARPGHLINGNVKSCGCYKIEVNKENLKKALLSENIGKSCTHGMYGTRPYRIWTGMKTRCNNERVQEYPDYGGRGITYCDKWETFQGFWDDMEDGYSDTLTIDRVDTNGNYCKENCKWDTMKNQSHNRRKMKSALSSTYIGVSRRATGGNWRAGIVNPEGIKLTKEFKIEIDAALWYDNKAEEFYGRRPNKTERLYDRN